KLQEPFQPSVTERYITIGVFDDKGNRKDLYTKVSIDALNNESILQHTTLLYFSSEDIDFKNNKISSSTYKKNGWIEVEENFPDVINNTRATNKHQQSITERKLRRMVPFTSFHVGNKFYLPKVMVKHRQFANLLVPFKMVRNKQIVFDYLNQ